MSGTPAKPLSQPLRRGGAIQKPDHLQFVTAPTTHPCTETTLARLVLAVGGIYFGKLGASRDPLQRPLVWPAQLHLHVWLPQAAEHLYASDDPRLQPMFVASRGPRNLHVQRMGTSRVVNATDAKPGRVEAQQPGLPLDLVVGGQVQPLASALLATPAATWPRASSASSHTPAVAPRKAWKRDAAEPGHQVQQRLHEHQAIHPRDCQNLRREN
mmetsp:Transcript_44674/g.85922  ORF Transcript_44674/g.85922 Transcript_44674/m.85922 type:complete len:213 (+) Transcript_44674:765-1403(+)